MRIVGLASLFLMAPLAAAVAQTSGTPAYPSGAGTELGRTVARILADPAVSRAHWGIAVTTLEGTPIFGRNEGQYFRPASNNKIFTTATAMALLGPDATVTTTVETDGTLDAQGVLHGNLYLRGAGDANLSGRPLPYRSPVAGAEPVPDKDPLGPLDDLATQVAAKGVRHITGQVIGQECIWPWEPYGTGWNIDDEVWGYGAPVSALAVDDNQLKLTVEAKSSSATPQVRLTPDVHYLTLAPNVSLTAAHSASDIEVDREQLEKGSLRVTGNIAAGASDTENVAVLSPALFAAKAFLFELDKHGLVAEGKSGEQVLRLDTHFSWAGSRKPLTLPPDAEARLIAQRPVYAGHCVGCSTVLASRVSAPLAEDVAVTLKVSQNLHAEMMLRRLGLAFAGEGSFTAGTRVVRQYLINAGVDPDDFAFADGSGLSDKDVVTPRALATFLAFAAKQSWFAPWKAALPVGGVDGSLAALFKQPPLLGHVYAKTGTLGETRALSGYLDAKSGRTIVFSVLVDTHAPAYGADHDALAKIVEAVQELE